MDFISSWKNGFENTNFKMNSLQNYFPPQQREEKWSYRSKDIIGKGTLRPINNVKAIEKEDYLLNQLSQ